MLHRVSKTLWVADHMDHLTPFEIHNVENKRNLEFPVVCFRFDRIVSKFNCTGGAFLCLCALAVGNFRSQNLPCGMLCQQNLFHTMLPRILVGPIQYLIAPSSVFPDASRLSRRDTVIWCEGKEEREGEREALAMMEKTLFCILFPPFAEGLCPLVRPASITAQSLSLSPSLSSSFRCPRIQTAGRLVSH